MSKQNKVSTWEYFRRARESAKGHIASFIGFEIAMYLMLIVAIVGVTILTYGIGTIFVVIGAMIASVLVVYGINKNVLNIVRGKDVGLLKDVASTRKDMIRPFGTSILTWIFKIPFSLLAGIITLVVYLVINMLIGSFIWEFNGYYGSLEITMPAGILNLAIEALFPFIFFILADSRELSSFKAVKKSFKFGQYNFMAIFKVLLFNVVLRWGVGIIGTIISIIGFIIFPYSIAPSIILALISIPIGIALGIFEIFMLAHLYVDAIGEKSVEKPRRKKIDKIIIDDRVWQEDEEYDHEYESKQKPKEEDKKIGMLDKVVIDDRVWDE